MKQIHKNQNDFCETMDLCGPDAWNDKFNYLISLSDRLPLTCPNELSPYPILICQSRTHFHALKEVDRLHVTGWSNSVIQRGIIVAMMDMFDNTPIDELSDESDVFFHIKSGLPNHLTPLRSSSLCEMIRRITVLCPEKTQA